MRVDLRKKAVRPTNMTLVCICEGPYCPICSHKLSEEKVEAVTVVETMEDRPNV
jgi:hypothetical protein